MKTWHVFVLVAVFGFLGCVSTASTITLPPYMIAEDGAPDFCKPLLGIWRGTCDGGRPGFTLIVQKIYPKGEKIFASMIVVWGDSSSKFGVRNAGSVTAETELKINNNEISFFLGASQDVGTEYLLKSQNLLRAIRRYPGYVTFCDLKKSKFS